MDPVPVRINNDAPSTGPSLPPDWLSLVPKLSTKDSIMKMVGCPGEYDDFQIDLIFQFLQTVLILHTSQELIKFIFNEELIQLKNISLNHQHVQRMLTKNTFLQLGHPRLNQVFINF